MNEKYNSRKFIGLCVVSFLTVACIIYDMTALKMLPYTNVLVGGFILTLTTYMGIQGAIDYKGKKK